MTTKTTTAPKGIILYSGASLIDGQPIVCIATGMKRRSANAKTGAMIQTWIMSAAVDPVEAIATGADRSGCGDCPLRGQLGKQRACYVEVGQAPRGIWYAWKRGQYERFNRRRHLRWFRKRPLRLGAYGEALAVPFKHWRPLLDVAPSWTGYTHQWRRKMAEPWRPYLMASVETKRDAHRALSKGWRYFRSSLDDDLDRELEIHCPASKERGELLQCAQCGLCNGATRTNGRSLFIRAHGSKVTLASYQRTMAERSAVPIRLTAGQLSAVAERFTLSQLDR